MSALRRDEPLVEELTRAGVLLATGGLDRGTHVTASGGNITFTDGPFTESKEVIVSFALIEVPSQEEALARLGRYGEAASEFRHAAALTRNIPERTVLLQRAARCAAHTGRITP
jgi:hypothetical protein